MNPGRNVDRHDSHFYKPEDDCPVKNDCLGIHFNVISGDT
jgi:hypothetical protein